MRKLHLPNFFSKLKFPHLVNLSIAKALFLMMTVIIAPFPIVYIIIYSINIVFIILMLGWIPYGAWLILCRIYKWKDNKLG